MYYPLRSFLFKLVPKYNKTLYTICRRYVDHYNADNNSVMIFNGEIDFVKANAKKWKIIIDVGAHTGEWTQAVLAVNPLAQIHCFEPLQSTFEMLQSNHFPENVFLNQLALSANVGPTTMFFNTGSGLNSLYERQWTLDGSNEVHSSTIIERTTLDDYCLERGIKSIDMMKIDVEGSELDVLKGAHTMLTQRRIHCIQFEYDRSYIDARIWLRDMFELLQPLGYRMGKIYPRIVKEYAKYDQRLENFAYQNWVAWISG